MTLAEVKTFLWITDTAQDTQLTSILAFVESWASSVVWDLNDGQKTIQVKLADTIGDYGESIIPLDHRGCVSVDEINGIDVSSLVAWDDYNILDSGIVEFTDLSDYISNLKFSTFKVKYTIAWVIDDKYKGAIANICGYFLGLDLSREVQSEQLWPRKVQYQQKLNVNQTDNFPEPIKIHVDMILSYIPLHYKAW